MTLSNDYNIHTKFNYTDRKIDVTLSAVNTGVSDLDGGNSDLDFIYKVVDSNGKVVQFGNLIKNTTNPLRPALYSNKSTVGYSDFGLQHTAVGPPNGTEVNNSKYDYAGGFERPDATGSVYVDHFPLHFWASPYQNSSWAGAGKTAQYEQSLVFDNPNIPWSTVDDAYVGDKIIINGGNAVLKGAVDSVTNDTDIVVSTSKTRNGTEYSTQTIAPAILVVEGNGANKGDVYYCSSQSSNTLTIDGDVNDLTGQRVALMPIRTVTGSSGYGFNLLAYSGNGFAGPTAGFDLDDYIPTDIGSYTFTGNGGWAVDQALTASGAIDWLTTSFAPGMTSKSNNFSTLSVNYQDYASITGSVLLLESTQRAAGQADLPVAGSVCKYRGADGSYNTGIVTYSDVQSPDVNRPVRVGIYPPIPSATTADTTLDLDIYQPNTFTLLTYPEFDTEYTVEIRQGTSKSGKVWVGGAFAVGSLTPSVLNNNAGANIVSSVYVATGDLYSNTEVSTSYSTTVRTPSADIEITANEYESQFATISETTNFHVGPIHLSNGEILKDEGLGATKLPAVNLALNVKGGNPKTQSTFVNSSMYMTQTADIMERTNGEYSTAGIGVFTTSQVFNAAQTLICEVTGSYGNAVINKVISLPVQPSV